MSKYLEREIRLAADRSGLSACEIVAVLEALLDEYEMLCDQEENL